MCWTQTSEEVEPGFRADQRAVCSRSTDHGISWSSEIVVEPADAQEVPLPPQPDYGSVERALNSSEKHEGGSPTVEAGLCRARVPAWPTIFTVPYTDRIYIFYWYNTNGNIYRDAGHLYFKYSDDDGITWSDRFQIPIPRTDIDEVGLDMHGWNYGAPVILPNGKVMVSFTKIQPTTVPQLFENWRTEVFFLVAENLLTESDPARLKFTTYPAGQHGLIVPNTRTSKPFAQEASVVALASGRLLTVMRTDTGYLYYALSDDSGAHWSQPEIFRSAPHGMPTLPAHCTCPFDQATRWSLCPPVSQQRWHREWRLEPLLQPEEPYAVMAFRSPRSARSSGEWGLDLFCAAHRHREWRPSQR